MSGIVQDSSPWIGLAALLLVLAACALTAYSVRQKQLRFLPLGVAAALVCYLLLQGIVLRNYVWARSPAALAWTEYVYTLPLWQPILLLSGISVLLLAAFVRFVRQERQLITPMSVKAAADSLPAGLCFYLPGGRIVLVNETMQRLCQMLTGELPANGERLRSRLFADDSLPVKRPVTETGLLVLELPDGSAWAISESEARYHDSPIFLLMASDVTELTQKSRSLKKLQTQLAGLNRRLTEYYRDIAALTTQKEILEARVRLHDEMGADLLMIQRYLLHGGGTEEQAEIEARLRRNLSFLRSQPQAPPRNELELILQTARQLNLRIEIRGTMPQSPPLRHILATALHECMTNTLRHAGGDQLILELTDAENRLLARLTNNGTQPTGPIREQGGLKTLRTLTEQAGGVMTVTVSPGFAVCLELPKEVDHVPSGSDCG